MAYRHNPETVVDRIGAFEAEQRRIAREVERGDAIGQLFAGADEARHQQLREQYGVSLFTAEHRRELEVRTEWLDEQLRGWQAVRQQQIADGKATNYTKDTFATGDFVQRLGDWYPVLKVNRVSVTVPSPNGRWTGTVRFEHITDHVRSGDERSETAKAKAVITGTCYLGNCGPHASIKALMDEQ